MFTDGVREHPLLRQFAGNDDQSRARTNRLGINMSIRARENYYIVVPILERVDGSKNRKVGCLAEGTIREALPELEGVGGGYHRRTQCLQPVH